MAPRSEPADTLDAVPCIVILTYRPGCSVTRKHDSFVLQGGLEPARGHDSSAQSASAFGMWHRKPW
jgi:hypothetical protein